MDEILDAEITIKVTGNQWYWNYEYADFEDDNKLGYWNYDSFLIPDSE